MSEGREAGTCRVGLAASGNGVGLDHDTLLALSAADRASRVAASATALREAGADYVIDSIADFWPVLETISARISAGEKPL